MAQTRFGVCRFNSRAHGGRDTTSLRDGTVGSRFNSRAHGGRDTSSRPRPSSLRVSIHAPTGGATSTRAAPREQPCFNSRAHGGRDLLARAVPLAGSFQFTRPRGARQISILTPGGRRSFQFTRPRGARPRFLSRLRRARVSIHAPTGGATRLPPSSLAASGFQFTRPRGARRNTKAWRLAVRRFNSRAHGGRDRGETPLFVRSLVSIHAPTGGATQLRQFVFRDARVSIHAPTGGATPPINMATSPMPGFNSRAHGGRDRVSFLYLR